MQTFLPYPSFSESARVLDYRRLGKQRVECKQLLAALDYEIRDGELIKCDTFPARGWMNHPAAKMWRGYEAALAEYMTVIVLEWLRRGYNNTLEILDTNNARLFLNPPWLGDEAFHASHRSNLLRKDPGYYGQFGWAESLDLPYVWPEETKLVQKATNF